MLYMSDGEEENILSLLENLIIYLGYRMNFSGGKPFILNI